MIVDFKSTPLEPLALKARVVQFGISGLITEPRCARHEEDVLRRVLIFLASPMSRCAIVTVGRVYRMTDGTGAELGGSKSGPLLGHPAPTWRRPRGSFSIEGSPSFYLSAIISGSSSAPNTGNWCDKVIAASCERGGEVIAVRSGRFDTSFLRPRRHRRMLSSARS